METKIPLADQQLKLKNLLDLLISNLFLFQKQAEQIRKLFDQVEEILKSSPEVHNLPDLKDLENLISSSRMEFDEICNSLEKFLSESIKTHFQNIFNDLAQEVELPLRKKTILVVEDDPLTTRLITHYLKDLQIKIIAVPEAEAALEYLKSELPDLILLDLLLPGRDGFQFLNEIKKDPHTQKIPVLIMSSISGEKEILKALELGAVDYITKPFSPRIVSAKIQHYLNL